MNTSVQGDFVFDAEAAAAVMAEYQAHGVDMMIDLEHASVKAPHARSDTADARGWARLEVRNGELWAVDVRWTPDGARRLAEKTQRYISPVFLHKKDSRRIMRVVNLALTALPATDYAQALAASEVDALARNTPRDTPKAPTVSLGDAYTMPMDPEKAKAALEALKNGDAAAALAQLEQILIDAASGGGAAPEAPAAEAAAETPDPAPKPEDELAAKAASIAATLDKVVATLSQITPVLERANALASETATAELDQRRGLIAELVQLGVEFPSTAWEGDAEKRIPCARLNVETVAQLRDRVARHRAAPRSQITPPAGAEGVAALSAADLAACKAHGMTPEQFIEAKKNAARRS